MEDFLRQLLRDRLTTGLLTSQVVVTQIVSFLLLLVLSLCSNCLLKTWDLAQ